VQGKEDRIVAKMEFSHVGTSLGWKRWLSQTALGGVDWGLFCALQQLTVQVTGAKQYAGCLGWWTN